MNEEEQQARVVIMALRGFRDELEHIMTALAEKRFVNQEEKEELQGLLKSLKERIKQAAKTGTVSGLNVQPNRFERAYFAPALANASAHFRIKTNSHPINSNWLSGLYSVGIDIKHLLSSLEHQFPE